MRYIPNKINYDEKFDILYFNISDTSNSYGDQIDKHLILLKDMMTDEITGVTIYGYKKYFVANEIEKKKLSQFIELPIEYLS